MRAAEIKKYQNLNELAEEQGIVIFGCSLDQNIPVGELRQAFGIQEKIYNRSVAALSVKEAEQVYEQCICSLEPETILLHIGANDLEFFKESSKAFDVFYRSLLIKIKENHPRCRVAVVSLKNYENNPLIAELNKHLQYIAESENCEYADISSKKVWNPTNTKDAVSFVYSVGFVRPIKNKRPLYDLVKILFYM